MGFILCDQIKWVRYTTKSEEMDLNDQLEDNGNSIRLIRYKKAMVSNISRAVTYSFSSSILKSYEGPVKK